MRANLSPGLSPVRRAAVAALAAVMGTSVLSAPALAAPAAPGYAGPPRQPVPTVPVTPVAGSLPPAGAAVKDARTKPAPVWPAAGRAVVSVPTGRGAAPARAGDLPVRVAAQAGAAGTPGRVRVEVLDRAATAKAGVRGVLLRLDRADGDTGSGRVQVTVDYHSFVTAYGGDWAGRLRLVALPDCALSTPDRRECVGRPLRSRNDPADGSVSADVPVDAAGGLVALSAGPSGPAGDYAATTLQPSSTWSAGGSSGAFTWSYPMRVPPAVGGPAPQVSLSYSSQSVDGRHAASNNQPSWVGEGFEAWPGGFIERRYRGCADDMGGAANNSTKTGDLCWETDNATLSLNGSSGELIYNSGEGRWHLRSDDGSRIERKTGAVNGDNDGEYWVVTTTDGTQYWFGVNRLPGWASGDPVTSSTWTAPVFGNEPGEPCHAAAFADSDCVQAWRWNLDYVLDLHGNSVSYWYTKETNRYGRNNTPSDAAVYDRAGRLDRIAYGTRRDPATGIESVLDAPAPAQVMFGVGDRCLSGCASHDEAHWPDTPYDQECTAAPCTDVLSATFWTTRRLAAVTTQVRDGSGYAEVERWTLGHSFPDPGDGTRAGLWLSKVSHVGLVGGSTSVPDIEFTGVQLANRVDTIDFAPAMNWWRIAMIRNETGGTVSVTYSQPDCVAGQTPAPHTNTRRCYPVVWTPEGYVNPVTDWFHKYVVTLVSESDHTGGVPPAGSPGNIYRYDYLDGAAWHYADDDGLIDKDKKTWSDYRGYGRVAVTVGDPGEQTYTETRHFRGMHGDRASPSGGTRTVTIDGINDEDWYAGVARETKAFNGPGGAVVSRQTQEPWPSPATASRTINGDTVTARYSRIATTRGYTTLDAGRGERVTRTTTSYDGLGMPVQVDDLGHDGVPGDERCTKTDYTPRNEAIWLMDRAHRVQTYAVACAATGGSLTDADVIGETRTWYDGTTTFKTMPSRGLATRSEQMAAWNNGAPTFTTTMRAAYDAHGRQVKSWNPVNAATTIAYTPATSGPVTATTVTNYLGHATTTNLQSAWGLAMSIVDPNNKRTDLAYDGLGRLTGVWRPGRDKATQTANLAFGYLLRTDAVTVVSASRLNPAGNYLTTYALFDGLLRARQAQEASPSGGRILTDTFYDSAGRQVKTYDSYHALGSPGTTLVTAIDATSVHTQTRAVYDGAGRVTASIFQPYTVERWRTTTYYAGDRTDSTPPLGGTATSAVTDARGRTVQLRQYLAASPTGGYDATTYTFNRKGQLAAVVDPAGNDWTYAYDIRGRQTQVDDPDRGVTTSTYDNAGRVASSTDGRGKKLVFGWDGLNRKRVVYENQLGGPVRAQWRYDTLAKGQLDGATRVVGAAGYEMRVTGYTDTYQPTGIQWIIPDSETGLAGAYNLFFTYNVDGSLASNSLPSTNGDLPVETLFHGYSPLGLPTTLTTLYDTTNLSYVADTDYNALAQVDQVDLYTGAGGHVWQAFTRELETGRLTGVRTDRDSVTPNMVADVRFSHDNAGNTTKISDLAAGDHQCFRQDYLRRLTEAWTPASGNCGTAPSVAGLGGPAEYWHAWTLDKVGNRLTQTIRSSSGTTTTSYAYPAAGGAQPHTLTSAATGSTTLNYRYDVTGNTTCRPAGAAANTCPGGTGSQTLTWDPEGLLESSTDATGTTSFVYDADGNRLIRRDPTGKTLYLNGQEIRYTTSSGARTCTRYYGFGGQTVASRTLASGLTWLSSDHQGTAQVAINATTQASTVRRQVPYGGPRGSSPTWPNDKGFVGGTSDNTGLTHLGAREYDPAIGRFVSVDPIMDLADPQQIHGYSYANNSPITMSDPAGLDPGGGQHIDDENGWGAPKPGPGGNPGGGGGGGKGGTPKNPGGLTFSDDPNAVTVNQVIEEYGCDENGPCSLGGWQKGKRFEDLGPVQQVEVLRRTFCVNNPDICEAMREAEAAMAFAVLKDLFMELTGLADAQDCSNGSASGCVWTAVGFIPVGKLAKLKAIARLGDEISNILHFGDDVPWAAFCSFSADTKVLMADGATKPISEIQVGDEVLATDPQTGETGPRIVTHLWVHDDQIVDLQVGQGETISTTDDHPFWNATDGRWQAAAELDPGDELLTADGSRLPMRGLLAATMRTALAYNLTVAAIHTYYVLAGKTPVLVHNTNGCVPAMLDDMSEAYVRDRHMPGGAGVRPDKSVFNADVNLDDLVARGNNCACQGPNANGFFERNVNAGTPIGNLSQEAGGLPTSWYKVVQDKYGGVRSMYPIAPPIP